MNILDQITQDYKKNDVPEFNVGDTVKVHVKIIEGQRERIQVFEGYVLKMQNGGISQTFTVRRLAQGIGVRRAKLNYMRERTGKAARIKKAK